MGIRRYDSIRDIVTDFRSRGEATALKYLQDGELCTISYGDLADRVFQEAETLPDYADAVICDHRPKTVIRILADAVADRDTLMADERITPMSVDGATRMLEYRQIGYYSGQGAFCFFTSGSSGVPRVVILPQRTLTCNAWSGQMMLPFRPEDTVYMILPLSHVYGFVNGLLWGLAYGATVALGTDRTRIAEDLKVFRPTIFPAVPLYMEQLTAPEAINPELEKVIVGGARLSEVTLKTLREAGLTVYLGYGLTETASGIAITQDPEEPQALSPCPGADIRIEPDGEISVETPCLMEGYLGEPVLEEPRWYTGDLGRIDERGRLFVLGRKDGVDDRVIRQSWKTKEI